MGANALLPSEERGQAMVMFVLFLVVVIGFVAISLDVGLFLHERQRVQNAVDAGALAGAQELPDQPANARTLAEQWALANDVDLSASDVDISFRCLVGDRDGNGSADQSDIPAVCDPGGAPFTCNSDGICWAFCNANNPSHKCNTIVVGANKDVSFHFAPVLSTLGGPSQCFHSECNTGAIRAAACRGACGGPPSEPLDVVMVIDRTYSLCANGSTPCNSAGLANLNNIKNGAKAALQLYDPSLQHVGLVVLPKSTPSNDCQAVSSNGASGNWLITPLSSDYNNGGVLNTSSEIVRNINCLQMAFPYGTQTDLGNPMSAARQHLQSNGRPGVRKAIIFLTDGAANEPRNGGIRPCQYANQQATSAKNLGIEIFTIGFGVESERCEYDSGSPYNNRAASRLLADMATDSRDDRGGCLTSSAIDAENADGDHFLCEAKDGSSLAPLFKQVTETLASGSKLVPVFD